MPKQKDQGGFVIFLLLFIIVVATVIVYSFVRKKAEEHGIELPI